jgi:hypothetical protein
MAIIKCPECGHEVSDKAPFCPNCGVKIAGNVVPPAVPPVQNNNEIQAAPPIPPVPPSPKKKKSNKNIWIVSFIIALAICGIVFYMYSSSSNDKEKQAYESAMQSNDPDVLKQYLDLFQDAPEAHRDSIQAHLTMLTQIDQDWTNALVSGSKSALMDYLQTHPDSPHKAEIEHKIDSIDWGAVSEANTEDAYNSYLEDHPNGEHVDEAKNGIKDINAKTIQPEEKLMVSSLFRHFFQSINSKDEEGLTSTCSSLLTSFLGKSDATRSDVIMFLHKIWKDDITNMNWHINNDYKIDKKEVGDGEYEYTVKFSVSQHKEFTDPSKNGTNNYRISAKIGPDDLVSSLNMTKVIQ